MYINYKLEYQYDVISNKILSYNIRKRCFLDIDLIKKFWVILNWDCKTRCLHKKKWFNNKERADAYPFFCICYIISLDIFFF